MLRKKLAFVLSCHYDQLQSNSISLMPQAASQPSAAMLFEECIETCGVHFEMSSQGRVKSSGGKRRAVLIDMCNVQSFKPSSKSKRTKCRAFWVQSVVGGGVVD